MTNWAALPPQERRIFRYVLINCVRHVKPPSALTSRHEGRGEETSLAQIPSFCSPPYKCSNPNRRIIEIEKRNSAMRVELA